MEEPHRPFLFPPPSHSVSLCSINLLAASQGSRRCGDGISISISREGIMRYYRRYTATGEEVRQWSAMLLVAVRPGIYRSTLVFESSNTRPEEVRECHTYRELCNSVRMLRAVESDLITPAGITSALIFLKRYRRARFGNDDWYCTGIVKVEK